MNSLVKLLFVAIVFIAITGCATRPVTEVTLQEAQVVRVTIPDVLIVPCTPPRPMTREAFLELPIYLRERQLTLYSIELLRTIRECDIRFTEIRRLNANQ